MLPQGSGPMWFPWSTPPADSFIPLAVRVLDSADIEVTDSRLPNVTFVEHRPQVLCLVILICFSASTSAYSSLSVIEMILAAIFFVIYMCDLHNKIQIINWPWSDFFRTLIAAILYLITSIVVLVNERNHSRITAGVLGLIATCLFGYDAYTTFPLRQQRHSAAPTDPADGPV
uniref:Proteolipid protein 2 n=1 Tax=Equus caballus TaxID=9796 RepID=A0A9L0SXI1_HORSE